MSDPFGIEKSFKKNEGRLVNALLGDKKSRGHDTMDSKMRGHYITQRLETGQVRDPKLGPLRAKKAKAYLAGQQNVRRGLRLLP